MERMSEQPKPTTPSSEKSAPSGQPPEMSPTRDGSEPIVVMSGSGMGIVGGGEQNPLEMVGQPAKVMRIGSMIRQLLEEVRNAPLDEAARARLRDIHARSLSELEDGLAPELVEELERLSLPFTDEAVPSEAELRIAQAQLVGWLEGLFHGIQTALFAQQMAARAQFEEMRRQAMPGALPGAEGAPEGQPGQGPGLYL